MALQISVKQASQLLNKDMSAIYHMINDGTLSGYKEDNHVFVDRNELGIIRMLESGLTPKEVAEELNVGIATIKRWDASDDINLLHHTYSYNGRNYYLLSDVVKYKDIYQNKRKKETV